MTEQEVRETVKAYGWSFIPRKRRAQSYIYAAKRIGGKRKECYIGAFAALAQLTSDQLVEKLQIVVPPAEIVISASGPSSPSTTSRGQERASNNSPTSELSAFSG